MDSKHSYFFHYAICKHSYFFYDAICLSDIQTPSMLLWTVWCRQRRVRWTRRSSSSSWICLCLRYNTAWRPTVRPHWPCVCITAIPLYDWMPSPMSWTTSTRWVVCLVVWRLLAGVVGLCHHCFSIWLSAITHLLDNLTTVSGLLDSVVFTGRHCRSAPSLFLCVWLGAITHCVDNLVDNLNTVSGLLGSVFTGRCCRSALPLLLYMTECHHLSHSLNTVSGLLVSVVFTGRCCRSAPPLLLYMTQCHHLSHG